MTTLCAYCQFPWLRTWFVVYVLRQNVSHGMCKRCEARLRKVWGWTMTRLDAWRTALRRLFCGLRGHDAVLTFRSGRLSMTCHSCGHESKGWRIA